MSDLSIRQLQEADFLEIPRFLIAYSFRTTPPLPSDEEWRKTLAYFDGAASFVGFLDKQPVVHVAYGHMTQNIRGKLYPCAGVWGVSTHPRARRKGYAREVLLHTFAHMHKEGIPVSTLYAFRESFYQRLGYTTFPQSRQARFATEGLLPLLKKELEGEVELTDIKSGSQAFRAYLRQQQGRIHGMALFNEKLKEQAHAQNHSWLAIARVKGETKGMMLYGIKENQPMEVSQFYYDDSAGKYLLLEWLARHADQITKIEMKVRPDEYPETWLADINVTTTSVEAPLGRVIDVASLSGMQVGTGSFATRVVDPHCPWNEDCYRFESQDGLLQVSRCAEADCTLSIQAISALIYGTHDPESFAIRGWGNPSAELQSTLRSMFPPLLPYLYETF
ncbi:GNAT family N-acetyltransferase [Ktedonosporobacter rubrisoli]|uniref:GNAT family N-acetyltransferase n=1 Tax=Ktedonosporobacter rubrisoli TaxID=2509675 RepID=A0A4P6JX86_KTERU|nr:GNAT family N-acetyltransferase [Ktedonosporobacter rubrisoli]QBD80358.1 GNAT family N-acetyltransferase [Ktedonosporobacter rubrisoli]